MNTLRYCNHHLNTHLVPLVGAINIHEHTTLLPPSSKHPPCTISGAVDVNEELFWVGVAGGCHRSQCHINVLNCLERSNSTLLNCHQKIAKPEAVLHVCCLCYYLCLCAIIIFVFVIFVFVSVHSLS